MADEKVTAADDNATAGATDEQKESALEEATRKVREQKEDQVPHTILEDKAVPDSMRELVVEIPRAEWDKRIDGMFSEWRKTASIEGFRRGKAPVALLKRRFMKEASGEVVEKLVPPIARKYEADKKVTLYGVPMITDFQVEEGKPARLTFLVEVKPEIGAKDYTGRTVEATRFQMNEGAVDNRIEEMRRQNATYEEVDKAIADHDAAVLDVKIVDPKGRTVEQQNNHLYTHLHADFPPDVFHELEGKKAGDTVEVKAKAPGHGGLECRFTISVKSVKVLKVPELDDEFAKDLGFDSVDALRKDITESQKRFEEQMNSDEAFEAIVAQLVDAHEFEVPPTLKDRVKNDMMHNDVNYMYRTGSMPARYRGRTREEYREELEKDAGRRVKGLLLVDAIGLKENVTATEEDITAALEEQGREEGRKALAVRAALEKNREFDQFVEQVRFNKIRKFLIDNNTVNFVDPKPEPPAESKE